MFFLLLPQWSVAQVPQESIHPDKTGQALLDALRADYAPSQTLGYNVARDEMYRYLDTRDGVLIGRYGGYTVDIPAGEDPSAYAYQNGSGISAEHTIPQSMGAGNEPEKSDMHNLFPVKQTINSARSNYPFADVPNSDADTWYINGTSQSSTPSSNVDGYSEYDGSDGSVGPVFEPRESHKGNAARAALYFYTVYPNETDDAFFNGQVQTLLAWHYADDVDLNENDLTNWIKSKQGTANPFVLDTTLARRAFGPPPTTNPTVEFLASGKSVDEAAGTATLTVVLNNPDGTSVSADVGFDATNSTASGNDIGSYATQTVSFASTASDGATQSVTVTLTDDTAEEGNEVARFALQNLTTSGSAGLGSPSSTDLTIVDDDGAAPSDGILFAEGFDDATQYSISQGTDATDGSDNYFTRTDGSNIDKSYAGVSGSFFAGQDINDGQVLGTSPGELTWSGIDISGASGLEFSGLFGEVLDGSGDIDSADYLRVDYRVDDGAWTPLVAFENDGATYNTSFYEDTDFDGVGDGTGITSSDGGMVAVTASIPETGTTLDLRFTASVDSGDEDFAIDDFEVSATSVDDGGGSTTPASPLIITEIMQNPSDVSDSDGEYLEIYNSGSSSVALDGYVLRDLGVDSHTISSLSIAAGDFAVLCRNDRSNKNGRVPCDYQYSGIALANGADEVVLDDASGTEVDRVTYDGGPNWPDPTGATMIFVGGLTDDNNDPAFWNVSQTRLPGYPTNGKGSDKGTPGEANEGGSLLQTTALPVELVAFDATPDGRDVRLDWTTVSESNNAGFIVEYRAPSTDAASWNRAGFVEGVGTSDQSEPYTLRVSDLDYGTHTFRLRQVDLDGTTTILPPVEVNVAVQGQVSIQGPFPNPATAGETTLRFAVTSQQAVTVEVFDALGRRVATPFRGTVRANQRINVDLALNRVQSGSYFVRLRGDAFQETRRVVVVR